MVEVGLLRRSWCGGEVWHFCALAEAVGSSAAKANHAFMPFLGTAGRPAWLSRRHCISYCMKPRRRFTAEICSLWLWRLVLTGWWQVSWRPGLILLSGRTLVTAVALCHIGYW